MRNSKFLSIILSTALLFIPLFANEKRLIQIENWIRIQKTKKIYQKKKKEMF